jgi:hypothetical protein
MEARFREISLEPRELHFEMCKSAFVKQLKQPFTQEAFRSSSRPAIRFD